MKFKQHSIIIIILLLTFLSLAACAGGQDAPTEAVVEDEPQVEEQDEPALAVERYYNALVDKEQELLISLTCGDYESDALLEFDSFTSVETTLTDFSCQTVSQDDDTASVTCNGAISTSYDGELREFPLSNRTYLLVQQGGEWLMCGFE